jgi:hypothetical protein
MDIELQSKLLKLKGFLNEINHISYSYSQLGRNYSMNDMSNEKAIQLIEIYLRLLNQVKNLILNYEKENENK